VLTQIVNETSILSFWVTRLIISVGGPKDDEALRPRRIGGPARIALLSGIPARAKLAQVADSAAAIAAAAGAVGRRGRNLRTPVRPVRLQFTWRVLVSPNVELGNLPDDLNPEIAMLRPCGEWSPTTMLSTRKRHAPRGAFLLPATMSPGVHGQEAEAPSKLPENALDLVDGNPIDLGDLGNRHTVRRHGADARKLRSGDIERRLRLGGDRCFDLLKSDRHRR
jgi:hypothetical protein